MKVQVALLLLLVLGISCDEVPMSGMQEILKKWFGMAGRIMRFQQLFMEQAGKEGGLSTDKLKTAFATATQVSRSCFLDSLTQSQSVIKELAEEIKSFFKSENDAGGEGNDVGNNNEAMLKRVMELYAKMSKMLENTELKEDISQLANKFMEAFEKSKECFMNSVKESLTSEEVDSLKNLWEQSKP